MRVSAPHLAPQQEGPLLERQALTPFEFEGQWGLLSEVPQVGGKRDFTFRGYTQNALGTQAEREADRSLGHTYLLTMESILKR